MRKKMTPRERGIGRISRTLAEYEKQMAGDRRARRPIPQYAHDSVVVCQNALKRVSKQSDTAFEAWQLR